MCRQLFNGNVIKYFFLLRHVKSENYFMILPVIEKIKLFNRNLKVEKFEKF